MEPTAELVDRLRDAVQVERLLETAVGLIEVPSPTKKGRDAADRLASILEGDGFEVQRPVANWPDSPAVVARLQSGRPGRTLQFNGHLDTVHLPFVPPRIDHDMVYGSGAVDMKGGIAAMCEAMRAIRDTNLLAGGGVLLTAADLHEAPWGDARQLKALIDTGYVGDAVLVPEYLADRLPVMGRGMAILEVTITREGEPVHEVVGGLEQPRLIAAGAELIAKMEQLDHRLLSTRHPLGDWESIFIGQVHAGEIYNQSPTEFKLSGTRRWLPGTDVEQVKREYERVLESVKQQDGMQVDGKFMYMSDAFELDEENPIVSLFRCSYHSVTGRDLPLGTKPFLDDGNQFILRAGVPAITHGPAGAGAHTVNEEVPVSELVRVALIYALTAVCFCRPSDE